MNYRYQLAKRLIKQNLEYAKTLREIYFTTLPLLKKYTTNFSEFSDHSTTHTERIIYNSDFLVAQNLRRLNTEEIYIYFIACYFHDTGMGTNDTFYNRHANTILKDLNTAGLSKNDIIRKYHNEFSAKMLEILQPKIINLTKEISDVAQILCRGHRNYNLFDEEKFPAQIKLSNGSIVHVAYLTALLRFADHMDITHERSKKLPYSDEDKFLEGYVNAIRRINSVKYADTEIIVNISEIPKSDYGFNYMIDETHEEFNNFKHIVETRTDFPVYHQNIVFRVVKK